MAHALLIAVGNPIRSDDGLAWHAADRLSASSELRVLKVQQLTPELAEAIADADLAIFADACADGDPGELRCEEIRSVRQGLHFTHFLAPSGLLALADLLYGKRPRAFLVTLSGRYFQHGQSLSPDIARNIPHLVDKVHELVAEFAQDGSLEPSGCR